MDGMMVHRPPARYAVEGYLPRGLVTLLGAHGGMGKSYLALAFAALVACGQAFAGHYAFCGRALYVSLEDDEDMVLDRLRRIVLSYGLDPETVKANVTILTGTHGDCALAVEGGYGKRLTATKLMHEAKAAAAGHSLVVIDNASDGFGGNENDRSQVRAFMRMLADIARSSGAAVLLLAHIDKAAARNGSAGNSYSGSTAWNNSARSRLALTERNGAIELVQEKLNIGRKAEALALAWTKDAVLVPFEVTSAAAREAEVATTAADAGAVLDALSAAAAAGVSVPPGRVGAVTAQKALETFDELPAALRGTAGRERFWRAVTRLMTAGTVRLEPYRTPDRKQRERLRAYPLCAECDREDTMPEGEPAPIRVRAPNPPIPPAHSARGCADLSVEGISCNSAQLGAPAQPIIPEAF